MKSNLHKAIAIISLGLATLLGALTLAPSAAAFTPGQSIVNPWGMSLTDSDEVEFIDDEGNTVEQIVPVEGDIDRSDLARTAEATTNRWVGPLLAGIIGLGLGTLLGRHFRSRRDTERVVEETVARF